MKIDIDIYSPEHDAEDDPYGIVMATPTILNHRDLCVPIGECTKATIGPVEASFCDSLERNRFDQAPVEVPTGHVRWRLVSTTHLRGLATRSLPLTLDEVHFLPNDLLQLPYHGGWIDLEELFAGMIDRIGVIAYTETTGVRVRVSDLKAGEEEYTRREVYGLLTHADLNKQVVRAAIYDRLSHLETSLAQLVAGEIQEPWDWIKNLGENEQVRILGSIALSIRRNVSLRNPIEVLTLVELITVVSNSSSILKRLNYRSKSQFDEATGRIARIRNDVMHPVRPLVLGPDDIRRAHSVLSSVKDLQQRVSAILQSPQRNSVS